MPQVAAELLTHRAPKTSRRLKLACATRLGNMPTLVQSYSTLVPHLRRDVFGGGFLALDDLVHLDQGLGPVPVRGVV